MSGRAQPWDQQPGETSPAWQAFVAYRDLGLERSLSKAAEQVEKSVRLLGGWSTKHSWKARAQAYDGEQDRRHQLRVRSEQQKAFARNLTLFDKAKTKIESELGEAKTDLTRLLDVALKHERLMLEPPGGPRPGAGRPSEDEVDLTGLSDEEILLRMFEIRESVTADLKETADDLGISLEGLETTLRATLSGGHQW